MSQGHNLSSIDWFSVNKSKIIWGLLFSKIAVLCITMPIPFGGTVFQCDGDCESYLRPIDNFIYNNSYTPDYRMPGYGLLYLPGRLFFSRHVALAILIALQYIIDLLAAFYFIKATWIITQNKYATLGGFVFYGIGCTISVYNGFVLTETVTASLLVFALYHFVLSNQQGRAYSSFWVSICMVWAYFCRPVLFPVFIFMAFYYIFDFFKVRDYVKLMLFILPFIFLQGMWTFRNYMLKQKVFLLTETKFYPNYSKANLTNFEFSKTFDDFKVNYLMPPEGETESADGATESNADLVPEEIFTPDFNRDSIINLQRIIRQSLLDTILTGDQRLKLQNIFCDRAGHYIQSIKAHHPFLVYIKAPLLRSYNHIIKSSGVQYLYIKTFAELTTFEKSLKIFYILIFQLAKIGALCFLFGLFFDRSPLTSWLLGLCCVYGLFVHPVVVGTSDVRYLYGFYPIIAICAVLFINRLAEKRFIKT